MSFRLSRLTNHTEQQDNHFHHFPSSKGSSSTNDFYFYYQKRNSQQDEIDGSHCDGNQQYSSSKNRTTGDGCGFEQDHYCKAKCSQRHPSKAIICRNSLLSPEVGCSGKTKDNTPCKFQHPNTVTIDGQIRKVFQHISQTLFDNIDAKERENMIRKYIVKCPFRMDCDKICPFPPFMCRNVKCNLQHHAQQGDAQTLQNLYRNNVTGTVGQLIPASKHDLLYVERVWNERKASHKIVQVQKVVNPKMESLFEKRKKELNDKCLEPIEAVFHGTSQDIIKIIVEQGFDGSKSSRQAYGAGTYFTDLPDTAVSYASQKASKQVLMCKIVIASDKSDCNYVEAHNWFVMQNTSGILPIYVITIQ